MERIDDIGFGELKLIQRPGEFCYGVDAVLLADYAKVKAGSSVLDLGTGTGIIPLIISHKTNARKIFGVELQQSVAELAQRNVVLNNLQDRIQILKADIGKLPEMLEKGSFDIVTSNPPYMAKKAGVKNKTDARTIARHETTADLEAFIRVASLLLRSKGSFYLVHRPSRLVDILSLTRQYRLEPKRIRFVYPSRNEKPNILLIQCVKDGNPELIFDKPLYIHKLKGGYSRELLEIYDKV